ncbi:MAG: site-specific DNA-methyltransferase [Synechococcus sp.]|nr:site-specific DNA-methyltransferase [Synechococcus sp.]
MTNTIYFGDCIVSLREHVADGSVQTCVTSPPYFGLRDYGRPGQIGLEQTPDEYVAKMVEVFREVRRVLRDDGTLWLNLGDTYAANRGGTTPPAQTVAGGIGGKGGQKERRGQADGYNPTRDCARYGLKHKDLIGIPWRVAFALQADGWYLRQDIIWHKPNPMPESVRDRCTKAHEYIFLMSKSERYYYDAEAIAQPLAETSKTRLAQPNLANQRGSDRVPGKTNGTMKAVGPRFGGNKYGDDDRKESRTKSGNEWKGGDGKANKRSVWSVATKPYKGAHFATFPPDLIRPCILAGSRKNDIVLDPFMGSGTTAMVAIQHGRRYLGCELNPDYKTLQDERIHNVQLSLA